MQIYPITFTFTYTEQIVPPRCRKPRATKFEGKYTVSIPYLSNLEAPVAVIETDYHAYNPVTNSKNSTRILQYRWYNDQLWSDRKIERFKESEINPIKPVMPSVGSSYQSKAEHQELARKWAESHILVDGVVYQPLRGEPRLVANSNYFQGKSVVELQRYFNYNDVTGFKKSDFYRLDQFEEAIAECERIALVFKDNGDEVTISILYAFEVLIPEALLLNPQADQAAEDEEKFQTNLKELISETKRLFADTQRHRALKEALA